MDTGNILIMAILLFVVAIPFIIFNISRKKKKKEMLNQLAELAKSKNTEIGEYEISGSMAIGFDTSSAYLFFYKSVENANQNETINLKEISSTKISINRRKTADGSQSVIDGVELILNSKNSTSSILEFFNAEKEGLLTGQLELIEKWDKLIKSKI